MALSLSPFVLLCADPAIHAQQTEDFWWCSIVSSGYSALPRDVVIYLCCAFNSAWYLESQMRSRQPQAAKRKLAFKKERKQLITGSNLPLASPLLSRWGIGSPNPPIRARVWGRETGTGCQPVSSSLAEKVISTLRRHKVARCVGERRHVRQLR